MKTPSDRSQDQYWHSSHGLAVRKRRPTPRVRDGIAQAVILAAACFLSQPVYAQGEGFKGFPEMPPLLHSGKDARGAQWALARDGYLENSGNNFIKRAQQLKINGNDFRAEKVFGSEEKKHWVVVYETSALKARRDIYFDAERGGVRYVDSFHNISDKPAKTQIAYQTSLRSPWLNLYTTQGNVFDERLGSRDTGVFLRMPEDRENQGLLFLVCGERSNHKPGIETQNRADQLQMNFTLSLEPGQTQSIAYWIAQKAVTDASEIKTLTASFYRQQLFTNAVLPPELRATVVNFNFADADGIDIDPRSADLLVAINELTERLEILRTGQDILWVAPESQLSGDFGGKPLKAVSRFGDFEIAPSEIAAIQGGGGRGRQHKLFLRDGSVLQCELEAEELRLSGSEGWDLELDVSQIEYLLGRVSKDDGQIGEATNLFVQLHSGDVWGVEVSDEMVLDFMAPWGPFQVPMTGIVSMTYTKSPSPRYHVVLRDGSEITAFLVDRPLSFSASLPGTFEISAGEISGMWTAIGEIPKREEEIREIDDLSDVKFPACLLKGGNLIAGHLANEVLHVVTGATVTPLKTDEIVAMLRTYEEESELLPVFEIELTGGDVLVGTLREDTLRVETEHFAWSVPVPHFLSLHVPPEKP